MPSRFNSNPGTRTVSVFVPELLSGTQFLKNVPKSEIPELPALQLLLTRAIQKQDGFDDLYQGVCVLSGIKIQKKRDLPIAAIAVAADKKLTHKPNGEYFIFAEPVVMRADRDSLVLLESLKPNVSENSLSFDESEKLISEINDHFNDEPWQLKITDHGDWYLILNSHKSITTTNISIALFENAQDFLPKGDDARYWRQIINEIEMLLFSSTVNENRVAQNKPAVISLWLWGGGEIPDYDSIKNNYMMWGNGEKAYSILQAIADFSSIKSTAINDESITKLITSSGLDCTVIINTSLKTCWQQRDLYCWIDTVKIMEVKLFNPLLTFLRKKNIDSINLYLDDGVFFTITYQNCKRWWQPVKTLNKLSSLL